MRQIQILFVRCLRTNNTLPILRHLADRLLELPSKFMTRPLSEVQDLAIRKRKLNTKNVSLTIPCKFQKLTRAFIAIGAVFNGGRMWFSCNDSTHLAASLIEDDFHVENRSELLKTDNN